MTIRIGDLIQIVYQGSVAASFKVIGEEFSFPVGFNRCFRIEKMGPTTWPMLDLPSTELLEDSVSSWRIKTKTGVFVHGAGIYIKNVTTGWTSKPSGISLGLQEAIEKAYRKEDDSKKESCSHCFSSQIGKATGVEPGFFSSPCSKCNGKCVV